MVGVLHILTQVLGTLAVALLLPAAVGAATGEIRQAEILLAAAAVVGFISGAVFLALRGRGRRLDRVAGFVLVVAVWVVPPLIAAVPLMGLTGADFVTALFEAVSGYTTTGASVFPTLGPLGSTGIVFRAELQWLGGLMTLLTIVTVLAPSGLGGISDRNMALIAAPEDRFGKVLGAIRQVVVAYLVVTVACLLLLLVSGLRPFDALCLTFATVSTGGFMPIEGDLSAYANPFADIVIAIFMLIGATSIVWHRMLAEGRWLLVLRHSESYWVIAVALGVGIAYAASFASIGGDIPGVAELRDALGDGLFAGISLISTTGFEPRPHAIAFLPATIVVFLAFVGGGAISTAGGIKFFRLGAMFAQAFNELRRLVYPHSISGRKFSDVAYDLDLMKGVWANFAACLLVIACSSMLIGLSLPTYDGALTAAIAAFSNIGPLYDAGWSNPDGWPAFAEFTGFAKIVTIATMILGRIEVLVLLGAVNLAYWRS